jgi:hypothetical protein
VRWHRLLLLAPLLTVALAACSRPRGPAADITVTASYHDHIPVEVERDVVVPIENALRSVAGVERVRVVITRGLAERVIVAAVQEQLASTHNLHYLFEQVEAELAKLTQDVPETIRLKEIELETEQRRVAHFIDFIAEGRGSRALAEALAAAERRADELRVDLGALRRSREVVPAMPPRVWLEGRVAALQEVLERRTTQSALLLRKLLGTVRLECCRSDVGKPYYRAKSTLQPLALLESSEPAAASPTADGGSNALRWWS